MSYLTARPSRDLLIAARQEMTREWWDASLGKSALFVSELVLEEAGDGDPLAAASRLKLVQSLPLLEVTADASALALRLLHAGALPQEAPRDALHIAVASLHRMQYLVTWNFKHIANVTKRRVIVRVLEDAGHIAPVIATPEDLLEVNAS
ncbi:MAG: type II toxin-antitoxin system VapC family toxin [Candidatus Schekmanbacteria bacterium]|nr:type II toxin-antitoxin system VapC family toxin [Candidatus Schekmanbacteria bacterium]